MEPEQMIDKCFPEKMNDLLAEDVLKGLSQNLIRGWGMFQYSSGDGLILLLSTLMYIRAKLDIPGRKAKSPTAIQEEDRGFCEQYYGPYSTTAESE